MSNNTRTFIHIYKWWLLAFGLMLLAAVLFGQHYAYQLILEKSQAKATASLRNITNETLLEMTKVEMSADGLLNEIEAHLDNPDTMFVLARKALENKAIGGCSVSFEPFFFKQKGLYFSAYANNVGGEIMTEQEGDTDYQYFFMDWYLIARELNKKYWIEPYEEVINDSTGMKAVMTSYSQPIRNAHDSVVGVLSIDVPLKWLSDLILDEHPLPQSYCMLLGRGGTYIVHPDRDRLINETILTPTLEGDKPELRTLGRAMISGETGLQSLEMNGEECHVFYMPLGRIGWSLALVCPHNAMLQQYAWLSWAFLLLIIFAILQMLAPIWSWLTSRRDHNALLLIVLTMSTAGMLTSCGEKDAQKAHTKTEADSLINIAYKMHDYERLLSLTELHQSREALSDMKYHYWRGYAYSRMRKMRLAEMEWTEALQLDILNAEDLVFYAHSANRLASVLYQKNNYEQVIRDATAAINLLREREYDTTPDFANLQTFLGCCQLKLGRKPEAEKNFREAWLIYQKVSNNNDNIADYTTSIIGILTITDAYIDISNYEAGLLWAGHLENMLAKYRQHPMYDDTSYDKEWARLNMYRATALEGLGRKEEAEKAYQNALATHYAKTGDGKMEMTTFLMAAKRWNEAADNFMVLDQQMRRYEVKKTLDNIQEYMNVKFLANISANRKDSALATANEICEALDSAIIWERQNSAIELATIYETQQKETEIMEQEAEIAQHRYMIIVITLLLLLLILGLLVYFRHQASNRMKAAYQALEKANERANESSRMKSEFIRQISHEIRTPLNILSGFTQVITQTGNELNEEQRQEINQQITSNTNRITELINKMLELSDAKSQSNIERNDSTTAALIAAEAISISGISDAKHLNFELKMTPGTENIALQTNQAVAVRALSLLLDNAVKFTKTAPSGHQTGRTLSEGKQTARLIITKEEERVVFCVEDTGIGVPADAVERIFEEFVQLNNFYDGTGIGLTVARSMAQRLGGNIVLDTKYTNGARFLMTLPCS